jgi:hypothetical protein
MIGGKGPKKNVFTCRMFGCNHHEFATQRITSVEGQQATKTVYHICKGCSVHFSDPDTFSTSRFSYIQFGLEQIEKRRQEDQAAVIKRLGTPCLEDENADAP